MERRGNTKNETLNAKQFKKSNAQNTKRFDLEERTLKFAKKVNEYVKSLAFSISNRENAKQLVRSAGSVGANYIEANEALSKKDFLMRVKICRKEAKETGFWLNLTEPSVSNLKMKEILIKESVELMKIFGAIVTKCS